MQNTLSDKWWLKTDRIWNVEASKDLTLSAIERRCKSHDFVLPFFNQETVYCQFLIPWHSVFVGSYLHQGYPIIPFLASFFGGFPIPIVDCLSLSFIRSLAPAHLFAHPICLLCSNILSVQPTHTCIIPAFKPVLSAA